MDIGSKLSTAVGMAEKVADNGKDGANGLDRYMPSRADYLERSQSC